MQNTGERSFLIFTQMTQPPSPIENPGYANAGTFIAILRTPNWSDVKLVLNYSNPDRHLLMTSMMSCN